MTFDSREKSFEKKYAVDEELAFRISAHAIKSLCGWVAEKMGLNAKEAQAYTHNMIAIDLTRPRHGLVINKIEEDFRLRNVNIPRVDIGQKLEELLMQSREDMMKE